MTSPVPGSVPAAYSALFADFSLDVTAKELGELEPARGVIPAGTSVQLAFPDSADLAERVSTARAIKGAGFTPVPIIAARRLRSAGMLREYLAALRAADAGESVLIVGGDPVQPQGSYPDAAAVIGSGSWKGTGCGRPALPVIPVATRRSPTTRCGRPWPGRRRR